jgi:hypothetical protein
LFQIVEQEHLQLLGLELQPAQEQLVAQSVQESEQLLVRQLVLVLAQLLVLRMAQQRFLEVATLKPAS